MTAPGAWRISRGSDGKVELTPPSLDLDAAMLGSPVAEAPELAARLHSLCPVTHRCAVRAALGAPLSNEDERDLRAELAAMATLRIGVVWPLALGQRPIAIAQAAHRAALGLDFRAAADLLQTLAESSAAHQLVRLAATALGDLPDPETVGQPLALRFERMRRETLELAWRLGDGGPRIEATSTDHGVVFPTLRGRLEVELAVKDGRITAFSASSPTSRLLKPGAAAEQVCRAAYTQQQARIAVLALDPCAAIEVEFAREAVDA